MSLRTFIIGVWLLVISHYVIRNLLPTVASCCILTALASILVLNNLSKDGWLLGRLSLGLKVADTGTVIGLGHLLVHDERSLFHFGGVYHLDILHHAG